MTNLYYDAKQSKYLIQTKYCELHLLVLAKGGSKLGPTIKVLAREPSVQSFDLNLQLC